LWQFSKVVQHRIYGKKNLIQMNKLLILSLSFVILISSCKKENSQNSPKNSQAALTELKSNLALFNTIQSDFYSNKKKSHLSFASDSERDRYLVECFAKEKGKEYLTVYDSLVKSNLYKQLYQLNYKTKSALSDYIDDSSSIELDAKAFVRPYLEMLNNSAVTDQEKIHVRNLTTKVDTLMSIRLSTHNVVDTIEYLKQLSPSKFCSILITALNNYELEILHDDNLTDNQRINLLATSSSMKSQLQMSIETTKEIDSELSNILSNKKCLKGWSWGKIFKSVVIVAICVGAAVVTAGVLTPLITAAIPAVSLSILPAAIAGTALAPVYGAVVGTTVGALVGKVIGGYVAGSIYCNLRKSECNSCGGSLYASFITGCPPF